MFLIGLKMPRKRLSPRRLGCGKHPREHPELRIQHPGPETGGAENGSRAGVAPQPGGTCGDGHRVVGKQKHPAGHDTQVPRRGKRPPQGRWEWGHRGPRIAQCRKPPGTRHRTCEPPRPPRLLVPGVEAAQEQRRDVRTCLGLLFSVKGLSQ
jgi:hypothetical protein